MKQEYPGYIAIIVCWVVIIILVFILAGVVTTSSSSDETTVDYIDLENEVFALRDEVEILKSDLLFTAALLAADASQTCQNLSSIETWYGLSPTPPADCMDFLKDIAEGLINSEKE